MLLWMGGSRRKVTTSRKSAQKRQKQYFEQRKRQHQQAAVLDSHADPKEHRSLDVLSLLNLSTTAEERKCACLNDSVDYKEVVTSSGYQAETISPKNFKFTASDSQNNAFNESSCDSYLRKTTNIQQISVFDLLADDGPSGNLEASPVHEAHVAFSVEGLGKVGTQTPILSPEQCERMFQYVCSSPQKAARRHNLLKNFDYVWDDLELEVDVMMQDTNKPMSGGYLEFSSGTINSRSHRKLKYSTVQDCEPFDGCGSKLQNSFGDSEFFHGVGNNSEDLWDVPARSSFVDDNLHIENRLNASGRNWQSQSYGNELSDSAFEFPHLHKNRYSTNINVLCHIFCTIMCRFLRMFITVDNASANTLAIAYVKKLANWSGNSMVLNGLYMHVRCSAHIINLIVQDGLSQGENLTWRAYGVRRADSVEFNIFDVRKSGSI